MRVWYVQHQAAAGRPAVLHDAWDQDGYICVGFFVFVRRLVCCMLATLYQLLDPACHKSLASHQMLVLCSSASGRGEGHALPLY
jgi:hypothetical protein